MSSFIYNSALEDLARGAIDFDTDSFKVMLVTSAYTENKDTHTKRSDVTNELAAGNGYAAGGVAVVPTISKDLANDRVEITFPQVSWPNTTLTARKAVYYKSRGGAGSADELVAINDFGADVVTTNGALTLQASIVRLANT